MLLKDQIFDACRITATRISAPEVLAVLLNTKILFKTNLKFILELRYMLLRYDKCQKFDL
jgi:hypothetical protein